MRNTHLTVILILWISLPNISCSPVLIFNNLSLGSSDNLESPPIESLEEDDSPEASLDFLTINGPASLFQNFCTKFEISLNSGDNLFINNANKTINLSATMAGQFLSTSSNCSDLSSTLIIPAGKSKGTFYFKTPALANGTISVSNSDGLFDGDSIPLTSSAPEPSGNLDSTFGTNGIVTIDHGTSETFLTMSAQSDGTILAAGYTNLGSYNSFLLAKFRGDGSLDPGFGENGIRVSDFGAASEIRSIVVLENGTILAGGYKFNGTNNDFAIARYSSSGTLDSLFGDSGLVVTDIQGSNDAITTLLLQSDGKIIASGTGRFSTNQFTLTRYSSDGLLDTETFGTNGIANVAIGGSNADPASAAIQADGKIIQVGAMWNGSNFDFALARFKADGSLDEDFSGDGKLSHSIRDYHEKAASVILLPDGKILVSGFSDTNSGFSSEDIALVKYEANGDFDLSFGSGTGKVTTDIGAGRNYGGQVILDREGKIWVVGQAINNHFDMALIKYETNGDLDTSFNSVGYLIVDIPGADNASCLDIQPDGKIVFGGISSNNLAVGRVWP